MHPGEKSFGSGMKMKGKALLCLLLVLSLFAFAGVASAKMIYVPDNYAKIQWAVDNASAGDTIIVRDGTYYENINVNKSLTIKSENGYNNCSISGVAPYGRVFNVTADYVNISGFAIPWTNYGDAIYVHHANHCMISDNKISSFGIVLSYSNYSVIKNNTIKSWGISLRHSNYNTIEDNYLTKNLNNLGLDYSNNNLILNNNFSSATGYGGYGIQLRFACNNIIANNNCSSNHDDGINIVYLSNNNTIENNEISGNGFNGISIGGRSNNNSILNNRISNNHLNGIVLDSSSNNKVRDNTMTKNGIIILGSALSSYIHDIDTSNTVNGKPVYYWKDTGWKKVPENAGQIILVNCTSVKVNNLELNNGSVGIEVCFSSNIEIKSNNCSFNNVDGIELRFSNNNSLTNNICSHNIRHGIYLENSDNNTVKANNISLNIDHGICIWSSHKNVIYLNNFIDNHINCASYWYSETVWNSTMKIAYSYNGSVYTNYLGNYWSDYNGGDNNSDGIGDTAYSIGLGWEKDYHPLMQPWENYLTPENQPPNTPSNPSPANHTTDVPIDADLSWTGGDPDPGDTVTYDVYFGTSTTPPLVSDDQPSTTYDLGTLNYSTEYYWKIIATDNHGTSTEGPLWDFCTEAAPGAWSEDTRLTEDDDIDSLRPAVAISGNSVYVVWSDHRDGNDEIYFKKSSDGGITWGPDVRLTNTSKASDCPDITVSPNGHIHVVWRESHGTGPQGQPHQIHYMRSEDGGNTWMDVKQLTAYPASYAYTYCIPAICSDSQRLYLVWHDNREGGWHNPYYKISTDDGATWSADTRLSNERISSHLPSVASDGAGGVHVVFSSNNGATTNSRIYYKRSLDWGSTWDTDVRLCTGDGSSISPSVAVDGNNVHVIWMSDKTGCYELYYRKSSDRGTTWGPEVQLTETDGNSSCTSGYNKAIAVSGEKVRVVWMDQRDGNWEIYYKESTDGGATWSDDVRLTDDPAISYCPDIAATTDEIHVVWQDERDGNYEIYYKRLTVAANKIFDTGAPSNPYPSIAGTHHGTITPNRTIAVNKLYTYPCLGTGGHTESIELEENGELIANGTWNGYQGDWHNITLHNVTGAPYVRLLKGHKYNYTIVTGSYPQIHHTDNHSTPTGFITCSEFVDANGKRYNNWIPAIKLFLQ